MEKVIIRVKKKDAAFVYWAIEGLEGAAFHSTVSKKHELNGERDIAVFIPDSYIGEVNQILFKELKIAGVEAKLISREVL